MADIKSITLPSGTTYNIKDEYARNAIAGMTSFDYVICSNAANTPKDVVWSNGASSITGTLAASASTKGKIYLVPSSNGTRDIYDEYMTINTEGNTYVWEMFGNTDVHISDLGDLAYKDSASGSYKPEGTVSKPSFTGNLLTSTGNITPAGTVSAPTITVTPNTVSKYVAANATGGGSATPGTPASCTLPTLSATVENENLTLDWSAGSFVPNTPTAVTMPSFSSQTIATGIKTAVSTQPTFTGTEVEVAVSGTPSGSVSQPTFTGTSKTIQVS